jgi:hypothetical protein
LTSFPGPIPSFSILHTEKYGYTEQSGEPGDEDTMYKHVYKYYVSYL